MQKLIGYHVRSVYSERGSFFSYSIAEEGAGKHLGFMIHGMDTEGRWCPVGDMADTVDALRPALATLREA